MNDRYSMWSWYPDYELYKQYTSDKNFQPYWLRYFKLGNESMLRAMSPAQRRELEAKMMADYAAYVAKLLGTDNDLRSA